MGSLKRIIETPSHFSCFPIQSQYRTRCCGADIRCADETVAGNQQPNSIYIRFVGHALEEIMLAAAVCRGDVEFFKQY